MARLMGVSEGYTQKSKKMLAYLIADAVLVIVLASGWAFWITTHLDEKRQVKKSRYRQVMENSNLVLYVSNQSFNVDPVRIKVWVDSDLLVDQDFEVGNQHNWIIFGHNLPQGNHTLRAESSLEGVLPVLSEFIFSTKLFFVINFWSDPRLNLNKLTIDFYEKEPRFL